MKVKAFGIATAVVLLAAWTPPPVMAQSVTYKVAMSSANQTPAIAGKASGSATLTLTGNTVKYTISVKDLSGPATMAHIHIGKAGVSGPPAYTFTVNKVASGKLAEGTIDLSKNVSANVSGDSLKVLLNNGSAYINVHTAAHPGGEIRGQVMKK